MTLEGRTALVTGAATGIGAAVSRVLGQRGARVLCVDVDAGVQDVASDIDDAEAVVADLTDREKARGIVHDAAQSESGLDIVVNVAGITRDGFLHKMTDEQWDLVIDVNLTAVFTLTRAAVQEMRVTGNGRIVNVSSASWLGNLAQANYAASKAGVVGLTRTAAQELGRSGGTANVVCPGFIDTAMTRKMPEDLRAAQVDKTWLGRVGEPDDVAKAIAFLVGPDAAFVTGEVLNVGGGYRV